VLAAIFRLARRHGHVDANNVVADEIDLTRAQPVPA
jgi:hypothetical protein